MGREELICGPHGEICLTLHMGTVGRPGLYEEPRGSPCAGLDGLGGKNHKCDKRAWEMVGEFGRIGPG